MNLVKDVAAHNAALTREAVGDSWSEFITTVPKEHTALYERGIATVLFAYPDTLMITQIIELVGDESLSPEDKGMSLRYVLLEQLVDIINKMGVWLNKDYISIDHLIELMNMAEFFYTVGDIQDANNTILPFLLATDTDPKYRLLNCLGKALYDDTETPDVSEYEWLIEDVAEATLKSLADSLTGTDYEEIPPTSVIDRVKSNRDTYDNTLGYEFIKKGGSPCSAVETYLNYYASHLTALLTNDDIESAVQYGKEIISLHLISDYNDSQLEDKLLTFFDGRLDNIAAVFLIEKMVKSLKLNIGAPSE